MLGMLGTLETAVQNGVHFGQYTPITVMRTMSISNALSLFYELIGQTGQKSKLRDWIYQTQFPISSLRTPGLGSGYLLCKSFTQQKGPHSAPGYQSLIPKSAWATPSIAKLQAHHDSEENASLP